MSPGILSSIALRCQEHGCSAIGDLATVLFAEASFDDGVILVVLGEALIFEGPVAGLGIRVAFGIAEVELGDACEMLVLEAIALCVNIRQAAEHVGPGE